MRPEPMGPLPWMWLAGASWIHGGRATDAGPLARCRFDLQFTPEKPGPIAHHPQSEASRSPWIDHEPLSIIDHLEHESVTFLGERDRDPPGMPMLEGIRHGLLSDPVQMAGGRGTREIPDLGADELALDPGERQRALGQLEERMHEPAGLQRNR